MSEQMIQAGPADLKIVEDHGNLDVLSDEEFTGEAQDTLTILNNHIKNLEIDGDRQKLSDLMRSLYTESLDVLI